VKTSVIKRSVAIAGHKTSVSLEDAFWQGLKEIAKQSRTSLADLVDKIDTEREHLNLSSAIRLFVLDHAKLKHALSTPAPKTNSEGDEVGQSLGV
jgi:predicted DNA-binding ribbon-helix-helix protein